MAREEKSRLEREELDLKQKLLMQHNDTAALQLRVESLKTENQAIENDRQALQNLLNANR